MTRPDSQRELAAYLLKHGITDPLVALSSDVPEPVFGLRVPGNRALACWQALRALVPSTRSWPVMIATDDDPPSSPSIASAHDVANCLQDAEAGYTELVASSTRDAETLPDIGAAIAPFIDGSWHALGELLDRFDHASVAHAPKPSRRSPEPESPRPASAPAVPLRITTATEVSIALLPTEHGWQAPAYLPLGWEFIAASQVASSLRRLGDLFGAELVGMTSAHIELTVARPPDNHADARLMSTLLMSADEGRDPEVLLGASLVSVWWD